MAEDETNTVSAISAVSASSASGISSFQIRQHFISPQGFQLANNAVVPVQTGAISHGNSSVQIPKAGVPMLGASAVSGQLSFQAPVVSQSVAASFQQTIPVSQSNPVVTTAVVGQQITLQKGQQVTLQRGQSVTLQRFPMKDSLPTTPSNVSAAVGQEVTLQRGQQVTLQRGRPVTLQRFQSKGQPITVQRFPAVLPSTIHRSGVPSNQGKVPLGKPAFITQASSNLQLSTKALSAIPASQNNQVRFANSANQQLTVQRIINPILPQQQQNSGLPSSPQIVTNTVGQGMAVSLHNNETLPVGTATILPGHQISIQPRPASGMVAGPASVPITLTVTSISPAASPVISSSSSSAPIPVIAHTSSSTTLQHQQQQQPLIQRPGVVISQPSVIRAAGFPVVLPRSALSLSGRQLVLQETLQRLIHRPLVSQTGNCGGQVTVQIPHIVGPIIKMPSFKQPATPTLLTPSSTKESPSHKVPSPVSFLVSTAASAIVTTTASISVLSTTTTASAQPLAADSAQSIVSLPSSTTSVSGNVSHQPPVCLTEVSESSKSNCLVPGQAQLPTTCTPSSSIQSSTESCPPFSCSKEIEKRKEEDNDSVESRVPSTSSTSKEEGELLPTSTSEVSNNISVLPNSLATLRNHKNNLSNKDGNSKDEKKQNPGMILTEGFIDSNLLDWNDNVGTLPGTDMKFKINEFGDLELLDEGDNEKLTEKTEAADSNGQKKEDEVMQADHRDLDDIEDEDDADDEDIDDVSPAVSDPAELLERENDPICCCVYCGRYGYKSNFRTSGRFCSRTCVGKKNMHRKELLTSRMLQLSSNKRKTITVIGEVDHAVATEDSNGLEKNQSSFDWEKYLAETGGVGAAKRLFKEPFPTARNGFKLGMRLEGVDPKHQALICVLSVAEIKGFRLRLHFDGYSECYDFWVNADSPFIFPVGWAEKNGKTLQPPKNMPISEFNWTSYLKETRAVAAPKHLFLNQPSSVTPSAFRVGMKLEARDFKHSELYSVATVSDTLGDRILIHFDGWEDNYDFWCEINSPDIRPVGWCHQNHKKLSAPPDYGDAENFDWDNYLADTKSTSVPSRAFKPRSPVGFETGMKLEVTDKRNPILIRVATVKKVKDVRLLIHFDGWSDVYDYWIDDESGDLHPPHWCAKTLHSLEPPIDKLALEKEDNIGGCPTIGCKGIGHIKGAKYTGHHSDFGCPYSAINMSKDTCLADRLGSSRSEEGGALVIRHDYHGDIRRCPTPGCNGLGHVTGKFTSHHCVSGCPLAERNMQKAKEVAIESRPVGRPARGRKRKIFGVNNFGSLEKYVKTEPLDGDDENNMFRASVHESVFQSMSAYPPVREQPLGWSDHTKLLPGVFSIDSATVDKWSIDQVADFIHTLTGKEEQAQRFRDEEIDGDSFLLLQQSDLVNFLNIKLGPAVKIFNSIQILRAGMDNL